MGQVKGECTESQENPSLLLLIPGFQAVPVCNLIKLKTGHSCKDPKSTAHPGSTGGLGLVPFMELYSELWMLEGIRLPSP